MRKGKRDERTWRMVSILVRSDEPLPLHPAYGLPDAERLAILRDAAEHGVATAAREHRVSPTVIYNWCRALLSNN